MSKKNIQDEVTETKYSPKESFYATYLINERLLNNNQELSNVFFLYKEESITRR